MNGFVTPSTLGQDKDISVGFHSSNVNSFLTQLIEYQFDNDEMSLKDANPLRSWKNFSRTPVKPNTPKTKNSTNKKIVNIGLSLQQLCKTVGP